VAVALSDLGLQGQCAVRDLWAHQNLGTVRDRFAAAIAAHGAGLYRISPE
jgi:alpha-galactosidase